MSGGSGTPNMRQRYNHGYASSGDDLEVEDDACSMITTHFPVFSTTRTWIEVVENAVWVVCAVLIVYLGDFESNLVYLLFHDDRIRRLQMYVGLFGVILNIVYFFYKGVLALDVRKSSDNSDILLATYGLTFVTILGLMSFCLFCFALWPIWSFFTLPLVFTLLMASMVTLSYLVIKHQSSSNILRTD